MISMEKIMIRMILKISKLISSDFWAAMILISSPMSE